jgi:hypothetical protein
VLPVGGLKHKRYGGTALKGLFTDPSLAGGQNDKQNNHTHNQNHSVSRSLNAVGGKGTVGMAMASMLAAADPRDEGGGGGGGGGMGAPLDFLVAGAREKPQFPQKKTKKFVSVAPGGSSKDKEALMSSSLQLSASASSDRSLNVRIGSVGGEDGEDGNDGNDGNESIQLSLSSAVLTKGTGKKMSNSASASASTGSTRNPRNQ